VKAMKCISPHGNDEEITGNDTVKHT